MNTSVLSVLSLICLVGSRQGTMAQSESNSQSGGVFVR